MRYPFQQEYVNLLPTHDVKLLFREVTTHRVFSKKQSFGWIGLPHYHPDGPIKVQNLKAYIFSKLSAFGDNPVSLLASVLTSVTKRFCVTQYHSYMSTLSFYCISIWKTYFQCKGWLAIAKLKPLSLFISLLSMPKKAFDNVKIEKWKVKVVSALK